MSNPQPASTAQPHPATDAPPMHEQMARAFRDQMHTLALHRHPYEVFRAFIEIAALTIHQSPYHAGMRARDDAFDRIERAYLSAVKPDSPDELEGLVKLYSLATLAFSTYPAPDLLGRVDMELDLGHKRSGPYFTPPPVARAMAKMMVHDVYPLIDQKGFVTLSEPTCGSGCLLIEAANRLHELGYDPQQVMRVHATDLGYDPQQVMRVHATDLGYDPQQVMRVHATDISRDGFNMADVQLSWLGIAGMVVHGDTLRMAEWECRPTPMLALMTQTLGLPTGRTSTPPVPMADPTQNPPDIRMPGEQLGFHFERNEMECDA
jgi:hypothetical protein